MSDIVRIHINEASVNRQHPSLRHTIMTQIAANKEKITVRRPHSAMPILWRTGPAIILQLIVVARSEDQPKVDS